MMSNDYRNVFRFCNKCILLGRSNNMDRSDFKSIANPKPVDGFSPGIASVGDFSPSINPSLQMGAPSVGNRRA